MTQMSTIPPVHQSVPVTLSKDEAAAKYPPCIVTIIQDGKAKTHHARIVGRSICGAPTYDVMIQGTREVVNNLPRGQVRLISRPRRVA